MDGEQERGHHRGGEAGEVQGTVPFGTSRAAVAVRFERTDEGTVARAEVSPLTGLSPLPHPRALAQDMAGTLWASLTEGRADMGGLRSKRKETERSYRASGRERVVQGTVIALVGVMISAIIFLSEGAEGIGPVPLALTILLVCVDLAVAMIGAQIVTLSRQMVRIDRELLGEEH